MQQKEKWQEVLEEKRKERLLIKAFMAFILGVSFYFLQPYISYLIYPSEVNQIYEEIENLKRQEVLSPPDERELLEAKIEQIESKIEREYPIRPSFIDFVKALQNKNWRVVLNFFIQFLLVVSGLIGFWLFYRFVPLRFVFRQPEIEPAIEYGKFDPKFIQPEKWGIKKEQFLSLFKSQEDFEKFVRVIDKRMKRKIELFEGGYKEFNLDEVNDLIGKLLDIIEKEGDILASKKVSKRDKWHMRASLGLAILHRILFWFGHIPEGALSIFFKNDERGKVTKLVLAEYTRGKSLRPTNPIFEKAGRYLSYLHLAKVSVNDFPEDFELFDTPEMSVLEFIDKKFKTLPD